MLTLHVVLLTMCRMDAINKRVIVGTRVTAHEAREIRKVCRALRVRQSEFVRRAIARLVAETLEQQQKRDVEAA